MVPIPSVMKQKIRHQSERHSQDMLMTGPRIIMSQMWKWEIIILSYILTSVLPTLVIWSSLTIATDWCMYWVLWFSGDPMYRFVFVSNARLCTNTKWKYTAKLTQECVLSSSESEDDCCCIIRQVTETWSKKLTSNIYWKHRWSNYLHKTKKWYRSILKKKSDDWLKIFSAKRAAYLRGRITNGK